MKKIICPKYFLMENVRLFGESKSIINDELNMVPIDINSSIFVPQSRPRQYWFDWRTKKHGLFGKTKPELPEPKPDARTVIDILLPDDEVPAYAKVSEKALLRICTKKILMGRAAINPLISPCLTRDDLRSEEGVFVHRRLYVYGFLGTDRRANRVYRIDGLAVTQTKSIGGGGPGSGLYLTPNNIRPLCEIERCRLQGLPDFYTNPPFVTRKKIARYKQGEMIGDAWTLPVIVYILQHCPLFKEGMIEEFTKKDAGKREEEL